MAVDTSKLRRGHRLGSPPVEGAPGIGEMPPAAEPASEIPPEPRIVDSIPVLKRQRVPPSEAEPRIPFTTRVTLSTKERLEDACYHLRRRHQEFINEAIVAYLEKHGF
jgi:hypothetical protein